MQIEIIQLSDVKVAKDRQRREPAEGHIKDLVVSIKENGLLHAPVLAENDLLVAGFCRVKAIALLTEEGLGFIYNGQMIEPGRLPIVRTLKFSDTDLFQIELEENLRRKNLSFIEQAQAIARLHQMRSAENPLQTNKDTASELEVMLGIEPGSSSLAKEVADSITLSQFAHDPEVSKARTKGAALRIANKKLEKEALAALGVVAGESLVSAHKIIHGDALAILPTLEKGVFDCIITDPPYGIGADSFGDAGFQGGKHSYKDDKETALAAYRAVAEHGYWLCTTQAHAYVFLDIRNFGLVKSIFEEYNWSAWSTPLIWNKGTVAHAPRPDHGPKRCYEAILFASKGDKRTFKLGMDILQFAGVNWQAKVHSAEKPVELYFELLSWSVAPGMKVLDPFAGSGPVFLASEDMGCEATGIELDEQFANICKQRIGELSPKD